MASNETLFQLIGTTYGGDGVNACALPDLRSRVPIHQGTNGVSNYVEGQQGGVESVTVQTAQMPGHRHALNAGTANGTSASPSAQTLAAGAGGLQFYDSASPKTAMSASAVTPAGGSQAHDNLQPLLAINFIISMFGIFPSRN